MFSSLLFPDRTRTFPGKRWVKIALRTLHLVGVAGMGGGLLYPAPPEVWLPFWWLTAGTGALFVALEIWSNGVWLLQVRGVAVLGKLALLACLPWAPGAQGLILIAVIVISGLISHAPASVRYYSVAHGRRIETLGQAAKKP